MLDCHSCLSRCLRAIITPVRPRAPSPLSSSSPSLLRCSPFLSSSNPRRLRCSHFPIPSNLKLLQCRLFHHSPATGANKRRSRGQDKFMYTTYNADPGLADKILNRKRWRFEEKGVLTRAAQQKPLTGAEARLLGKLQLHVRAKEIKDPYDLLEYVKASIANGGELASIETVIRKVSYHCNTVASWNYYIARIFDDADKTPGRVGDAGRAFNMMKKCSTKPDSHTYMTMLVGLLKVAEGSPQSATAAARRAASFYHCLSLPTAKIKNSTMLMNAAMNVCARAGEMDMIWGIAAKMPDTGEGAADHITYSIILNAMRNNIQKPVSGSERTSAVNVFARTIMDAKGIWMEVISKHRAGELAIDSSLVGAMGRILLLGESKKDWDDVLSLVEQTMDIPRLFPALDAGNGLVQERPRVGTFGAEPAPKKQGDVIEDPFKDVFKLVDSGKNAGIAAPPSNNTLSLVLETCNKLASRAGADAYWKLFTDSRGYDLSPDLDNIHVMLRLHKDDGDSRAALDMLQKVLMEKSTPGITGVTFRIALGSCKRVRSKGGSFADATGIVDLMLQHIPVPDYRTIVWYSELALQQKTPEAFPFAIERLSKAMRFIEDGHKQLGFITKFDGLEAPVSKRINDAQNVLLSLIKLIDISLARHQRDTETMNSWRELRSEAQDNLHDLLHDEAEHVREFSNSIDRKRLYGWVLAQKLKELADDKAMHEENLSKLAPILDKPFGTPYKSRRRNWKLKDWKRRASRVAANEAVGVGRASDVNQEERQESDPGTELPMPGRRVAKMERDAPSLGKGARTIRNIRGENSALKSARNYAMEKQGRTAR